ncbi:MAG TPA: glycoside hydrolase family 9 protein [Verrucomicrobiae bacterium]
MAHQSAIATGLHQHYFDYATATLAVNTGDKLFAYVYLDPANPPRELMLQWTDGSWEHRAYWGENLITYGTAGTASRYNAGALPATGQWVRLEVPASAVGLEGRTVKGMAFAAYGGRVTWDYAGKANGTVVVPADMTAPTVAISAPVNNATVSGAVVSVTATAADNIGVAGVQFRLNGANLGSEVTSAPYTVAWNTTNLTNGAQSLSAVARDAAGNKSTNTVSVTVNNVVTAPTNSTDTATVWVDNAVPAGATSGSEGGDTWNWVSSNPAPYSGAVAHQSAIASGMHQHYFDWATATMTVNAGDKLFTYIYLDPANVPSEVMLQWNDGSWEHRAYWGANTITSGVNGTASRYYVGALPAAGQWVRLEVPASAVGLEGKTVRGMAFTLYGGRATWDYAGKSAAGSTTTPTTPTMPTVTASVTDATAVIGTTDNAVISFTRTGDTSSALLVNYNLGGSAVKWTDYRRPEGDMPVAITIPAGSASANLTLVAVANVGAVNPQTVALTLATNAAYTVGTASALTVNLSSGTGTSSGGGSTNTNSTNTNIVGTVTNIVGGISNVLSSVVNYTALELPKTNDSGLNILAPTVLELKAIGTKAPGGVPSVWNLVNSGTFSAPALNQFEVTVNGQAVAVSAVGFKRRPLYAPLAVYDLRIENNLYLQLASAIPDNATVEVKNPSASLWNSSMKFTAKAEPLRYSPAIHVNQEGYVPSLPKKAMVGYYLGNLGEMNVSSSLGFSLVNVQNGATAFTGTLKARADVGYVYTPTPYQKVLEADFSNFTTPGEYQLMVPGLGASLPFLIDDGIAMGFTRAYALGLYHQRCGTNNVMPFTRHTHENCHHDLVSVPMPSSSFQFTWTTISNYAMKANPDNVAQTAPKLTSPANQLFPFIKTNLIDVTGGHHDAGDYSKYTINSANLIHYLMFAVDSVPGIASLDNLGVPESGDGISDVLQAAKWEADFLAKLQDTDGGFYFLVYPREREYESGTQPDQGDEQVVWPKTTSSTAASVAALAQTASSPLFKQKYPAEAAAYLAKAKLGWTFLTNAVSRYGKAGSYQKITHYGDDFTHDDELAWAAAEMFVATGEAQYQQKLNEWLPDPSSSATFRWGWWRLYGCYGHAIRSYAFAARSGRLTTAQLNAAYLAKCEGQVIAAADDALLWSNQGAYGSSFPAATKRVRGAGWYFSNEQAFDIVVAQQITPKATYVDAMLANLNYEAGCNPVNVSYLTGMGWKRQREIVHQYAQSDRRVMPPAGIPQGNIQAGFIYSEKYGSELTALTFPNDDASTAPYPYYDRWADNFNVTTEFVAVAQARGIVSIAYLATLTPTKTQAWKSTTARIVGTPTEVGTNSTVTVSMQVDGLDLSGARIVWEARDQEPAYGSTFTFKPASYGDQWIEAEAQWADGRRAVATASFFATNSLPTVSVVATDVSTTEGADTAVYTFTRKGSTATALTVNYKLSGTAAKWTDVRTPQGDMPESIVIPAGATSATLTVCAYDDTIVEGTETAILTIQANAAYNLGTPSVATVYLYDNDGPALPTVTVTATDAIASENLLGVGVFTITRTGSLLAPLTINYTLGGTATQGVDYNATSLSLTLPIGISSAVVIITPVDDTAVEGEETVVLSLSGDGAYQMGAAASATISIADNDTATTLPTVSIAATDATASKIGPDTGTFTVSRTGSTASALTVNLAYSGTATNGADYNTLASTVTIPAGSTSTTVTVTPKTSTTLAATTKTVTLASVAHSAYTIGTASADATIAGNVVPIGTVKKETGGMRVTWNSVAGKTYRVVGKKNLTDTTWTELSGSIQANTTVASWLDTSATAQGFYMVYVTN